MVRGTVHYGSTVPEAPEQFNKHCGRSAPCASGFRAEGVELRSVAASNALHAPRSTLLHVPLTRPAKEEQLRGMGREVQVEPLVLQFRAGPGVLLSPGQVLH